MDEVLQKYVKFMLETDINARCGMDRSNQQKIAIGKIISIIELWDETCAIFRLFRLKIVSTVKSGNFVTFFAQNIFFSQNYVKVPHIFFLVGNSYKNCFSC